LAPGKAQEVEHNYPVGPQNTNCDSLVIIPGMNQEIISDMLENTVFRFSQEFRLRRFTGLQYGKFYSCDGIEGYLIIQFDGSKVIYQGVDKTHWDALTKATDPDNYYLQNIQKKHSQAAEGID
jgi:hypothetical protein